MAHDNLYTTGEYNQRRFFSIAYVGPKLLTLHDVLHLLHYLTKDPACRSRGFFFLDELFKYGFEPRVENGILLLNEFLMLLKCFGLKP